MRAVVRRFHSPDVDLETFVPMDPTDVGILVQIMVGPADGPGEESFDVVVCTPQWLERWVKNQGPQFGQHHLIVDRYDAARVRLFLTMAIESEEADSWADLAMKIGRIAKWEFEDYQN